MLVADQVRLLSDADLRSMPFRLGDRLGEWSEDVARACVDELLRRERERCAKECEDLGVRLYGDDATANTVTSVRVARSCAERIRGLQ